MPPRITRNFYEATLNHYDISLCGNIVTRKKTGRVLKQQFHKSRCGYYMRVRVSVRGLARHLFVHRLQCYKAYGKPRSMKYEANHKDRDTTNNGASNLEWVTPRQNQKHWRKCGND